LPKFRNTVHLHRQQHRHPTGLELSCQRERRAGSPTVTIQDDPRRALFICRWLAPMISREKTQHRISGVTYPAILKRLDMHAAGIVPLQIMRHDHRAVHRVIVPYKSTYEADNNRR